MAEVELPEPDRVDGAPHPRETRQIFGQDAAQAEFLQAFNSGRLHHGWLITGPKGIGKATLAWQIARFLLTQPIEQSAGLFSAPEPPTSLAIPPDHPVEARIQAMSEPGLFLLRRGPNEKGDKLAADILVKEVRKLKNFFSLSAADGGRRVVIVDAADEMNVSAANALLKVLEEPPANTILLLVCHQPSRLLPTIRSRCRELRLAPMGPEAMAAALSQADAPEVENPAALAEISAGSVGEAIRLVNQNGLAIYQELVDLYSSLPRLDRSRALKLAESAAARGAEAKLDLLFALNDLLLARLARAGALGQPPAVEVARGEAQLLARLSSTPHQARAWADLAQDVGGRTRHGRAVNLDPAALILDTIFKIQKTAAG